MLILLTILLILTGWMLVARGRRGRTIDDHPVCRRCRFDLIGKPVDSHKCPECGAVLNCRADYDFGNRKRRDGLIALGAGMVLLGIFSLGSLIVAMRNIDMTRFKPDWLLIHDARNEMHTNYNPMRSTHELSLRVQAGSVSAANRDKIVSLALARQADHTLPWNPEWGDMIEWFQANGLLSSADWQKYLAQDEFALMEVRANCDRGNLIPFHIQGELRGATPLKNRHRQAFPQITGSVPGVRSTLNWSGGSAGSSIDINGEITIPVTEWPTLKPGPKTLSISVGNMGGFDAKNPALFPNLHCTGAWNLLPAGQTSAHFYHDEFIAAQVEKCLTCRPSTIGDIIALDFGNVKPPVNLAFDVFIKRNGQEFKSENPICLSSTPVTYGWWSCDFPNHLDLVGHYVDVILRPSLVAPGRTMHMDKVLDHEFVLHDVLLKN